MCIVQLRQFNLEGEMFNEKRSCVIFRIQSFTLTSVKKTDRMTRLIQWMIQANWNALLTVDTIQRDSALTSHIVFRIK